MKFGTELFAEIDETEAALPHASVTEPLMPVTFTVPVMPEADVVVRSE